MQSDGRQVVFFISFASSHHCAVGSMLLHAMTVRAHEARAGHVNSLNRTECNEYIFRGKLAHYRTARAEILSGREAAT